MKYIQFVQYYHQYNFITFSPNKDLISLTSISMHIKSLRILILLPKSIF